MPTSEPPKMPTPVHASLENVDGHPVDAVMGGEGGSSSGAASCAST
jgi:hypothetical protein